MTEQHKYGSKPLNSHNEYVGAHVDCTLLCYAICMYSVNSKVYFYIKTHTHWDYSGYLNVSSSHLVFK